jgi:hypothetical protein
LLFSLCLFLVTVLLLINVLVLTNSLPITVLWLITLLLIKQSWSPAYRGPAVVPQVHMADTFVFALSLPLQQRIQLDKALQTFSPIVPPQFKASIIV